MTQYINFRKKLSKTGRGQGGCCASNAISYSEKAIKEKRKAVQNRCPAVNTWAINHDDVYFDIIHKIDFSY